MALRYWVGGTGSWSSTSRWSTTSGGGGGASVPTAADDVIFNASSGGKFTATVDVAGACQSLTITPSAGTGVLTIAIDSSLTTGNLTVSGTAGNNRVDFIANFKLVPVSFVINGIVNISDCSFNLINVSGTASPISGTRIGNKGFCRNIIFSNSKTVYWNLAGSQNWSANGWSNLPGGSPSANNFPLPQDIAVFDDFGSMSTIVADSVFGYLPTVDFSARTNAVTINFASQSIIYGNWIGGSGLTISGTSNLIFRPNTLLSSITSAGKTFTNPVTITATNATVVLNDAFISSNSQVLNINSGVFKTQNYNITGTSSNGAISTTTALYFEVYLGSSTISVGNITMSGIGTPGKRFIYDFGTSNVFINNANGSFSVFSSGVVFHNLTFTSTVNGNELLTIPNLTFNNLTIAAPSPGYALTVQASSGFTVNGTFTCSGASITRRIYISSNGLSINNLTQGTITANSIVANNCDFSGIIFSGNAVNTAPLNAGNCGNNSGIIFPAPKTVYWNLAGSQTFASNGWCAVSGGTPDPALFPLAQDSVIFDNAGAADTVTTGITSTTTFNGTKINNFDASSRTLPMTLSANGSLNVFGDFTLGTGVTTASSFRNIFFEKNGIQKLTSNGVVFNNNIYVNSNFSILELNDALTIASDKTLNVAYGTFDTKNYNVTTGLFSSNVSNRSFVEMGIGTWTLSGTGTIWNFNNSIGNLNSKAATVVLSNTTTSSRNISGTSIYINKLIIGGSTGISTTTLMSSISVGEITSTKTVAHTISLSGTPRFGKWSVTGTVGNVVTVSGSAAISIIGDAVSGVDYLAMGSTTLSTTSPGDFYSGANSTGTGVGIVKTAAPTARTLYWVGGAGNWSSTTKWATSSGGASGAAIPTSLDDVIFDSLSNATAYTATIDPTQARCKSLTISGPLTGDVTVAGTGGLACHGNVVFPASGALISYTGPIQLSGSSSSTFTTNGLALASQITVRGDIATWTLGSALNVGSNKFLIANGTFSTSVSNYALTCAGFESTAIAGVANGNELRQINLNGSTITNTVSSTTAINIDATNLTFNAGTSQINLTGSVSGINAAYRGVNNTFIGSTFYNVAFASTVNSATFARSNTFNNLSFSGKATSGIATFTFSSNQTINGALTLSPSVDATYRTFLVSDSANITRTLTAASFTAGSADIDFQNITILGVAAPISGTRFGNCGGNTGITFSAGTSKYWNSAAGGNWSSTSWATTSGGTPDVNNFPLAQDTAVFEATGLNSGATVTINDSYNIGSIDMSARTSNTMTLSSGVTTPSIYGNWINGTGTTLSGTGVVAFRSQTTQSITCSASPFSQPLNINCRNGSVVLQDAFVSNFNGSGAITVTQGTFNLNNYNLTLTGATSSFVCTVTSFPRTLNFGSGTSTFSGSGTTLNIGDGNGDLLVNINGSGTFNFTSASSKTFATGGAGTIDNSVYPNITINQGGAGILNIQGSTTFKTITSTYIPTGATSINFLGYFGQFTVVKFTSTLTASGEPSKFLTISGASASNPSYFIYLGADSGANADYLTVNNLIANPYSNSWYIGSNSTLSPQISFIYGKAPVNYGRFFLMFG